jgi:hypothetical protein
MSGFAWVSVNCYAWRMQPNTPATNPPPDQAPIPPAQPSNTQWSGQAPASQKKQKLLKGIVIGLVVFLVAGPTIIAFVPALFGSTAGMDLSFRVWGLSLWLGIMAGPTIVVVIIWSDLRRSDKRAAATQSVDQQASVAAKRAVAIGSTITATFAAISAIYYLNISRLTPDGPPVELASWANFALPGIWIGGLALAIWCVSEAIKSLKIRRSFIPVVGLILGASLLWLALPAYIWLHQVYGQKIQSLKGKPTTSDLQTQALEKDQAATTMYEKVANINYDIYLPASTSSTKLFFRVPGDNPPVIVHPKGEPQHMDLKFEVPPAQPGLDNKHINLSMFAYSQPYQLTGQTNQCIEGDNNFDKSMNRGVCYRLSKTIKGVEVYGTSADYKGHRDVYAFVIGNTYMFAGSYDWQDGDAYAFINSLSPVSKPDFLKAYAISSATPAAN